MRPVHDSTPDAQARGGEPPVQPQAFVHHERNTRLEFNRKGRKLVGIVRWREWMGRRGRSDPFRSPGAGASQACLFGNQ